MTTHGYRKFEDRSERRWLGALIAALAACNLLILGPCSVGDIKVDDSRMRYGETINWDGRMPGDESPSCWAQYFECIL